jgi:hypothetical protein
MCALLPYHTASTPRSNFRANLRGSGVAWFVLCSIYRAKQILARFLLHSRLHAKLRLALRVLSA